MRRTQLRQALLLAAISAAYAGSAAAAGFQLQNQTGSGNGNAFAGAAATAEDAGTIFFNPAGMTMLPEGHSFSVAGTVLSRSIKYTDTGTNSVKPSTSNGKDAGGTSLIPAFYWAYSLDSSTRIGLGVSPTFGNVTDYGFDFIGRNGGYYANIKQYNVNPSVAFKLNDQVSVGLGLNYAANDSEFKSGLFNTTAYGTLKGKDSAYGYNLGFNIQIQPETRLALTYRSELNFNLDGTNKFTPTLSAPYNDKFVTAKLSTPATASIAISHKLDEKIELLSDLTWTGWSVIKSLDVYEKGTSNLVTSTSYNFRDTLRFGLGLNYQYDTAWKLRFGTAYDQSPVKSAADRTNTLPDSDRIWLAFGARYKIDDKSSIDFGYAHIFFADASTKRQLKSNGTTYQIISADWKSNSADLLSVQWNSSF